MSYASRIAFARVNFSDKISTIAISNITVGEFLISDSDIKRLDDEAFDIMIKDKFTIENTSIGDIKEQALYHVQSANDTAIMNLEDIMVSDAKDNAFKIRSHMKLGGNFSVYLKKPCDCDMYSITGSHELTNSTILNYVFCQDDDDKFVEWKSFDSDKCDDEHGHSFVIPGLGWEISLAIYVGGGVVLIIG